MANFKLDGAKFSSLEDLKTALWDIHKDKMSKEEFDKYVADNVEES